MMNSCYLLFPKRIDIKMIRRKGVLLFMDKKKLRYAILKKMDANEVNVTADFFGVTEKEFFENVTFLDREGYITKPMYGSNMVYGMSQSRITEKGENYLEENSKLNKGYKLSKEIRDWIKFPI
jgi:hypothetical protein